MRADRMISILLILQREGRATARQIAEEIEVSEKTVRRDLDALAVGRLSRCTPSRAATADGAWPAADAPT